MKYINHTISRGDSRIARFTKNCSVFYRAVLFCISSIRKLVQDFIRSVYIVGRAIRESPLLGTAVNEVRHRKRSEAYIYVSILKHSQANARSRTARRARIE